MHHLLSVYPVIFTLVPALNTGFNIQNQRAINNQPCLQITVVISQNSCHMSDPALNMMDSSVFSQCWGFTKQLINTRTSFSFDLKLPSGFYFSFTTTDKKPSRSRTGDIKKKSPSTLHRNAKRKQKTLELKKNSSSTNELSKESF